MSDEATRAGEVATVALARQSVGVEEALRGGTISETSFDGHAVRIDFETRKEADNLFALLSRLGA